MSSGLDWKMFTTDELRATATELMDMAQGRAPLPGVLTTTDCWSRYVAVQTELARREKPSMEDRILRCPEFLYSYSPRGTTADKRWVFADRTCLSEREAFEYAVGLTGGDA